VAVKVWLYGVPTLAEGNDLVVIVGGIVCPEELLPTELDEETPALMFGEEGSLLSLPSEEQDKVSAMANKRLVASTILASEHFFISIMTIFILPLSFLEIAELFF